MAFSHTKPATVQVNQLQFSSNPNGGATLPLGLSYNRFNKPQPIVIQKVGAQTSESHQGQAQAFHFTNVSTDSLNQAMQLAKRDLKQQRLEESQHLVSKAKNQTKPCMEKGKERRAKPAVDAKKMPPSRKPHQRSNQDAMPVAPHSPPVRDTDPHQRALTQGDRTIAEIHRLHQQIATCVRQIQRLQEAAAVDARVRRQTAKVYAEDIEEERKRQMRADEQTIRSARNIYQLGQQVKDLRHEINGLTIGNTKKKSQAYNHLAAAQRASIKALRAFVQHMPDFDVARKGMPASYAELGLLIEQLSVCCAQLGVAGLSGVPQSVLNLETSFMSDVGQTSPRSPPRLCQLTQKKSPASRCLDNTGGALVREAVPQKENKAFRAQPKSHKKSKPPVVMKHFSPDRSAALQAGVAALLRAASPTLSPRSLRRPLSPPRSPRRPLSPPRSPRRPLSPPRSPRRPLSPPRSPTVHFIPPLNLPKSPRSPRSRSVLTPRRSGVNEVNEVTCTHFAEPTFSSRAKQIDPHEWPLTQSPSAVRRSSSAPSSPSARNSSKSRLNHSILRDAWLEKQAQKDEKELNSMRVGEKIKLEHWRQKLGSQHKLLVDTEQEIRSKLQPILNNAEEFSAKLDFLQGRKNLSSFSSSSSESDSLPAASMNADIIGDMLVNELLDETIGEIDQAATDDHAEQIASALKHAPDVEALMDRLAQMECEQDEVRRRWASIVYQDADTGQALFTKCTDDVRFGNRGSPAPIEIVPIRTDFKPGFSTLDSKPNYSHTSQNAIVFTKAKPTAVASSSLAFSEVDGLLTAENEKPEEKEDKATRLYLSKDSLLNIQKNKADYEEFLRKTTQSEQGKFKPWQLMEEISEKIFDDCMTDVVFEIDRINSEIVEHVYGAEFAHVPEATCLDSCL